MPLRDYQIAAIEGLRSSWVNNPGGTPLIVCPTGAGKSLIVADIVRRVFEKNKNSKVLVLSHRKEIISQNAQECSKLLGRPVGVFSAGLGIKNFMSVTFGNIQSLYKREVETDLLIIDECHLISGKPESMYQSFIDRTRVKNPRLKITGLTATPFRMDMGHLVGGLFTDICYDISLAELIANGYLAPLISKPSLIKVDLDGVNRSAHDYVLSELEERMMPDVRIHCEEIIKFTTNRQHVLVFCSGINHAIAVSKGLPGGDYVTGEMVAFERDMKLETFKSGKTKYLCNCDILTTGFNYPGIDCIVLLRATQSCGLYVQMVGRGSRMSEGKTNCLILDFGNNIERHGPVDCIEVKRKKDKKGKAIVGVLPTKDCEACGAVCHIRVMICPYCGEPFPVGSDKITEIPAEKPIVMEPEEFNVMDTSYTIHFKDGKPPSLRVSYDSGMYSISDYFCFEHGGFASDFAARKWIGRGGSKPVPKTAEEGLERKNELHQPARLSVIRDGKYYRVLKILEVLPKQLPVIEEEFLAGF